MKGQQKDIIWILIDSLMPDFFNLDNKSYIEKLIFQGKVYTNVIVAEKFTLGSLYTIGTGLYGSVNGMNGIDYNFGKEKPDVLFVGDYLKKLGYNTLNYADRRYRHFPSSGIDIYELTRYNPISNTLGRTYDTPKRREMIEYFNKTKSPKFLFLHMWVQHDLLYTWRTKNRIDTTASYKHTLKYLSKDLSIIFKYLKLSGDELLVICSDHGIVLDRDFMKDEMQEGTSMRLENLKTFCTFISSDIEPDIINERCSNIDILPTIFDFAGLPAIPVQGRSLMDTKGTEYPICEGVEVHKYPFDTSCTGVYAIYNRDNYKVVIKKDQEKKLFKEEKPVQEDKDIINFLTKKIVEDLSISADDIKKKRIAELQSKGKDVLMLKRDDLPVKILLFVTEQATEHLDCFIGDMKSQIEHYFDLHFFNVTPEISIRLKDVDKRIKIHEGKFESEMFKKILDTYKKMPEFVGFVKTSNEYYEDYLYELRRILETNSKCDIAYAESEKNPECVFLTRMQLIKKLIDSGIKIKELSSLQKFDKVHQKIKHDYPLGIIQKKKFTIFPVDDTTKELLEPAGIDYIKPNQLKENKIDIIACSHIEKIKKVQELANLHHAVSVYIDSDSDSDIAKIAPSTLLTVIKRKDYRFWYIMESKTKTLSRNYNHLWQCLEDCIRGGDIQRKRKPKTLERKQIVHLANQALVKSTTYLPILNSYPVRKFLYPIRILGCANTGILKRNAPYNKNFNISNLPRKK